MAATDTPSLGSASIAALHQYSFAAESLGVNIQKVLKQFAIPPDVTNNAQNRVDGDIMQKIIGLYLSQSEHPTFGLFSSDFVRPESYSILGFMSMNARNLQDALEKVMPYEKLVGDMGTTHFEKNDNHLLMEWRCNYSDPMVVPHMIDNVFASWVKFARWLTGIESLSPVHVEVRHACPHDQLQHYQTVFQCPITFESSNNRLTLDKADLLTPLKMPNETLLKVLMQQAERLTESLNHHSSLCQTIKHIIKEELLTGFANKEYVSKMLHMSSRTLQRKLLIENTNFKTLCDEVRIEKAKQLLQHTTITLDELAVELGFSEASSLQRWFRRMTGMPAKHFANQLGRQQ